VQLNGDKTEVPGVEIVDSMDGSGSWGEAPTVRERMQAEGLSSGMVVRDPPHMLRRRCTWGAVLRGTGLSFALVSTIPTWWPGWRSPEVAGSVGNEVLKLGYYVVKYRCVL